MRRSFLDVIEMLLGAPLQCPCLFSRWA